MSERKPRSFSVSPAVRSQVPLLTGLSGPSGGGKTFSALRLATGMQRVTGGEIYGIDTESNRMLHYADRFKFNHLPFSAPFDPLSYLEAIEYCHGKGAKVIVVDSMSHEHEGPGGVLEMHAAEVDRMAKGDWQKAERVKMLAWSKPKQERRRLLNTLLQIPCHFVFCFRAKDKIKPVKGGEPIHLGYMPIAGEEFVFEMTVCGLLLPNAGGVPSWNPQEQGERQMVKLPQQFRDLLLNHQGPLDESLGERMAQWASGADPTESHLRRIVAAASVKELAEVWKSIPAAMKTQLVGAKDRRKSELEKPGFEPDPEKEPPANGQLFHDPADTSAISN